ncbi:MAG TPA: FAD-dependent oxidoreductase [Rectinemataceae bacterium]|nr:FAD-dependent oxidoreductase [Rectinemataceae bacterium]
MATRLVIVGGVAGGATAAARARRLSEDAEITIIERGPYVSFANCGLPYFIAGAIAKRSKLLLQTPEGFDSRYGVKVLLRSEAVEIDRAGKRVKVRMAGDRALGGQADGPADDAWLDYDKLILAQGGNPVMPPVEGAGSPNVFKLWTIPDMDRIVKYLDEEKPQSAVIAGGGFIGLEMAEAFRERGLSTTVVEMMPRLMPAMDPEFGSMIASRLESHGVAVRTGVALKTVHAGEREVELSDGSRVPAGVVLFSVGVRPELSLATSAGLSIGSSGGLLVDERLQTSDPDIFAAGDMVEVVQRVSGKRVRVPLAGPANRQGRIAASNALGQNMRYAGALGTSVFKAFDATVASTGLSETAAREAGFQVGSATVHKDHHSAYYPGAKELSLKLVYDRRDGRLLGAQAFGEEGVEKRIDVAATALLGQLHLADLTELDLAYAPPYSSANDPINVAAMVGMNDLEGYSPLETAAELKSALNSDSPPLVLDVRNRNEYDERHIAGSLNIPVDELRFSLDEVPRDRAVHVLDRTGFRGHLALRILNGSGIAKVMNVSGGFLSVEAEGGFPIEAGE